MRLIPNWKRIALRSFSMWAQYLGLLWLAVPEVLYGFWQIETNPLIWWVLAFATIIILGVLGRIVDQGIGDA